MDSKKKLRRPAPSSSSSSSEDSSFSSSSDDARKKQKRRNYSSSSSEEEKVRKLAKHKKSSVRKHSHSAKLREKMTHGKKARSMSPATRAAHKHKLKLKKAKYAQAELDHRSRSPSRRNVKKDRTPEHRIASPTTRIRVSIQNNRAIPERTATRSRKESPMSRRREQVVEKERLELSRQEALKESERLKRAQEEEQRYKRLKKHHHERSRSPSRGKVSIHDRLDGGYDSRRSIPELERDDYMMRDNYERPEPERNFEYREREEERRYDYNSAPRPSYEDRHHRHTYTEPEREVEPRRPYEPRRRFPEETPYESNYDKWPPKDDKPMRTWKDSAPQSMHPRGLPPQKRYPYAHPSSGPSSGGPPFKPRFPGSNSHFSSFNKRLPFKPRFPNQYSKINYPSKRIIPPTSTETSAAQSSIPMVVDTKHELPEIHQSAPAQAIIEPVESGEIIPEQEEDKVEADTTTMSVNVDTQSQEEGEGNLSEFSDVDDEILNREEELNAQNALKEELEQDKTSENELKIISKIHANNELKREMDLDFEEISDGELEEESRLKGLGDALGVDWESLAKETQKPINRDVENSSTKSLLTPHRILWDIGVSAKILGEETARKILTEARDKLREEKAAMNVKIESVKSEIPNGEVKDENGDVVKVKVEIEEKCEEQQTTDVECQQDFELDDDVLPHPLAQLQVLTRKLKMKRRNLIINSTSDYGRALSAKRDMKIRRYLCHLPDRDMKIVRNCTTASEEVKKNVFEIYKKLVDGIV